MSTSRASTPFDLDPAEMESMDSILGSITADEQTTVPHGEIIEARVIDRDDRDVFFEIGSKQDGRCALSEFAVAPAAGDVIPVLVVHTGAEGLVRLSHLEAGRRIAWDNLKEAREADASLTGKIDKILPQGYIVDCDGLSLFMPLSQSNLKSRVRNRFEVGKEIDFKLIEIKDRHRSAVISHRRILEERNDEFWKELVDTYQVEDVVEGQIIKKVSFGLFVSVCGVEGLLHHSDISWKNHAPFKNRFKVGEILEVKILEMDQEQGRLSLGLKQMSEDPWEWARLELKETYIVDGRVTSVTDYGAFIEITEGLEGLVHVSEFSWSRRQRHPRNYVEVDQVVEVVILSVDFENHRISLGMRQLQRDPWDALQEQVHIGQVMEGTITSITKFGAFVEVIPDIEGLIHFSDYSWEDKTDRKMLNKGDQVKFKILDINQKERRIGCGLKQLSPSPLDALARKHPKGAILEGNVSRIAPFGIFVDIGDGFEGLVHISRLPRDFQDENKMKEKYPIGSSVKTVLQNVDTKNRKIVLSIKAYEHKKNRELIDQYIKKDEDQSTSSLGAFWDPGK